MQPHVIGCPHCRGPIAIDPRFAGHVVACPHCRGHVQLPPPATAQPQPPPASDEEPTFSGQPEEGPYRSRRKAKGGRSWVVIGLIGALLVGGTIAAVTWVLKKPGQQEEAIPATMDDLLDEFQENELAFRKKYSGRVIEVTGYERERHPNEFDKGGTIVVLGGKVKGRRLDTINCNFPSGSKAGYFDHTTVIRGRCIVGDSMFHLDNCRLTDTRRDYVPQRKGASNGSADSATKQAKGEPSRSNSLTVEELSRRRKAICDKYPLQGFLVNEEWVKEYGGKTLEVSGVVLRIGTERDGAKRGSPVVLLEGDKNAIEFVNRPPGEGSYTREGVSGVTCTFPAGAEGELAKVKAGQFITVRGRFDASSSSDVQLKDCSILK